MDQGATANRRSAVGFVVLGVLLVAALFGGVWLIRDNTGNLATNGGGQSSQQEGGQGGGQNQQSGGQGGDNSGGSNPQPPEQGNQKEQNQNQEQQKQAEEKRRQEQQAAERERKAQQQREQQQNQDNAATTNPSQPGQGGNAGQNNPAPNQVASTGPSEVPATGPIANYTFTAMTLTLVGFGIYRLRQARVRFVRTASNS